MANDLTGDVWILDTADPEPVYTHQVKIKTIVWENPESVGDELVLQSKNGKDIVVLTCEVALQSQVLRLGKWYNGLLVDKIDSGVAYVHYY